MLKTVKKRKRKAAVRVKPKQRRLDRPKSVQYWEVAKGRHTQDGKEATLYVRVEERDGERSVSLGSDFGKLQIRVSAEALRKVMAKVDA